ncbi:hypothetical protein ACFSC1_00025 [Paracoccus aurantiacus]|nr:hypothetical protein [Paracoccus aurantiacus]
MTKLYAALAAATLTLAAIPASADCAGKPHDQTATTTPPEPVIVPPKTNV